MPGKTIIEIPTDLQEQMLAELRQARFGYLLALHILLLCAQGHTPTEIAAFLFCSRSSVYRAVEAYRRGEIGGSGISSAALAQPGIIRRYIPSAATLAALDPQVCAAHLRLVPHPVELCCLGCRTESPAWSYGLAGESPPLAA